MGIVGNFGFGDIKCKYIVELWIYVFGIFFGVEYVMEFYRVWKRYKVEFEDWSVESIGIG